MRKMKMRLVGFLAFVLLSISIMSYGMNSSVFAESHNIPPLSATAEFPSYGNGDRVLISGDIRDYDSSLHSGQAITYIIKSPDNNLVLIGQITPSSDGSFETNFKAGGILWKLSGDYTIEFHFGSIEGNTIIVYTGGALDTPQCASNESLVNGVCVENKSTVDETICGEGTELVNGICTVKKIDTPETSSCLIATAAYGSELAPQVQFLREIRDNTLLSTESGRSFMIGFNTLYYSFAPTVADWERENPMFKETVRTLITPMLSTLSIMSLADSGSEIEVLGLGISVIALNLGMYIVAPALIGFRVHKHIKSRK